MRNPCAPLDVDGVRLRDLQRCANLSLGNPCQGRNDFRNIELTREPGRKLCSIPVLYEFSLRLVRSRPFSTRFGSLCLLPPCLQVSFVHGKRAVEALFVLRPNLLTATAAMVIGLGHFYLWGRSSFRLLAVSLGERSFVCPWEA